MNKYEEALNAVDKYGTFTTDTSDLDTDISVDKLYKTLKDHKLTCDMFACSEEVSQDLTLFGNSFQQKDGDGEWERVSPYFIGIDWGYEGDVPNLTVFRRKEEPDIDVAKDLEELYEKTYKAIGVPKEFLNPQKHLSKDSFIESYERIKGYKFVPSVGFPFEYSTINTPADKSALHSTVTDLTIEEKPNTNKINVYDKINKDIMIGMIYGRSGAQQTSRNPHGSTLHDIAGLENPRDNTIEVGDIVHVISTAYQITRTADGDEIEVPGDATGKVVEVVDSINGLIRVDWSDWFKKEKGITLSDIVLTPYHPNNVLNIFQKHYEIATGTNVKSNNGYEHCQFGCNCKTNRVELFSSFADICPKCSK